MSRVRAPSPAPPVKTSEKEGKVIRLVIEIMCPLVVQLDRIHGSDPWGRGFESLRAGQITCEKFGGEVFGGAYKYR